MRWPALLLAATVAGCGSISELNPFGPKDERLMGDRETVFSTTASAPSDAGGSASVGPAQSNADWPQPGGNAQNAPGHLAFGGSAARVWRASVSGDVGVSTITRGKVRIASRPVVAGDRVFVYAPDGTVTALSASSGSRVWRTQVRPDGERDPAQGGGVTVDGGRVYVATGYGEMAALDAGSGEIVWRRDLDTPARGAPTVGGGKVFVVSQQNEVFAINASDGAEAFTYAGIPERAGLLATSSPAVAGDKVVIPYSSGEVMAFSIESGEPVWQSFVTRTQRTLGVAGLPDLSGSPVVDGGTVYATGTSGRTVALSLADGTQKWEQNIGSTYTPVVSGDAVFLVDVGNRMVALNRTTGAILWVTELPRPSRRRDIAYAGPVLAGGALYAISSDGRMAVVDPATGALQGDRVVVDAAYVQPIVANGQMIVVSDAGEITALR